MRISFRDAFGGGLIVALIAGLFLVWLWRPEHQIRCHTDKLLRSIEKRNWTRFAFLISSDYRDQWGNDRPLVVERTREVFRYLRTARLTATDPALSVAGHTGYWKAKITIAGDDSEVMAAMKERVNSLATPFQLEWRRTSAKPWDWKLVRVSNPELRIPEFE